MIREMKPVNQVEMRVLGKEKRSASKLFVVLTMLASFLLGATAQAAQTVTYYHGDAAGSTVAASDESGALLWRKSYDPYGDKFIDGEGDSDAIAYTGKKHDDVTGLTYMGARYYDPEVGRFMGMDAVGFQDDNPISFNRFAFANNNPYRYKDTDGNLPILIPVVIFIAKELAADQFERATGIPAVFSVKGLAKAGLKGIKALSKSMTRSAGGGAIKPIVVGENMKRVNNYADKIGGETIDGFLKDRKWSQKLNDEFIDMAKSQGRDIKDIGPSFGRRLKNRVDPSQGRGPSGPYGTERKQLKGYNKHEKLYKRKGKYEGGVDGFD